MTADSKPLFDKEPEIRVGLHTYGAPLLVPLGEYDLTPDGESVIYTPLNERSAILLENQLIGVGFHWQHTVPGLFFGRIEVSRPGSGWRTLNILPVERYLEAVTGSEMNPAAPIEFLKAHAVISRGWALSRILGKGSENASENTQANDKDRIIKWEDGGDHTDFDVCSDDHCQRYQGIPRSMLDDNGREVPNSVAATRATRGLVLTDADGNIADTRFSKCCGGHTELFSTCWQDADKEYLPAQPDPWCDLSDMSASGREAFLQLILKDYDREKYVPQDWQVTVSGGEIRERLMAVYGVDPGKIRGLEAVSRGPSGRIRELRIQGSLRDIVIGKELAIRRLLHPRCLYSSAFHIECDADSFRLHGRGWGHGVGLCQIGAARMAQQGYSFADILNFYYPGTSLTQLYD